MTDKSPVSEEYVRLWTTHGQRVYAYILSLLVNRADADEVFQDVSLTVWMKFDQFELGTNFRAWVYRIALNKVREFQRSHQRNLVFCDVELLGIVDRLTKERSDTLDTQYQALASCMNKLHPRDRDLIERRYRVGATPKSVSQQVGRSVSASSRNAIVANRLTRRIGTTETCLRLTCGWHSRPWKRPIASPRDGDTGHVAWVSRTPPA